MTLGDFWGVEKIVPELDDDKGTSVILIQTEQGREVLAKLAGRVESKAVSFADAVRYNPAITTSAHDHVQRAEAWKRLEQEPLAAVVADYTKESAAAKLKGIARRLLGRK